MGQSYSAPSSQDEQQQQQQPEATQGPARTTPTAVRPQPLNSVRGTGANERAPRRSRFSPYALFSSPRRRPQAPASHAPPAPRTHSQHGNAEDPSSSRMSVDTVAVDSADVRMAADDADARMAAGGANAGSNAGPAGQASSSSSTISSNGNSWQRSRVRMRAGNELLSRIVSRSVIASVAQELQRQRAASEAVLPFEYTMGSADRVELYFRISGFIQSILNVNMDAPPPSDGSAANGAAASAGAANVPEQPGTQAPAQQQEQEQQEQQPGQNNTAEPRAAPNIPSLTADDIMSDTNFQMFLLPSAIDQALAAYEREHRDAPQPAETAMDDAASTGDADEGSESQASQRRSEEDTALPEEDNALPEQANALPEEDNALPGAAPRVRALSEDEQQRAEQQRSREEKLRRLRAIAQAMGDDGRRNVQFPVMMLGLRLNPELQQQTRAVIDSFNDGPVVSSSMGGSGSSSSTSLVVEDSSVTNTGAARTPASPEAVSQPDEDPGQPRGLLNRMNTLLPNLLDLITSLRRVHNAASRSSSSSSSSSSADRPGDHDAASTASSVAASDSSLDQPGIAVFIMIHYMHLGNPLILPLVTHALFPELAAGDTPSLSPAGASAASIQSRLSATAAGGGSNYDLFLEIANIVGQVTATTVTQDIVDKRLRTYVFRGRVAGGAAVARLVDSELPTDVQLVDSEPPTDVQLLSAERCPVCLDAFAVGELLRVLSCCHGLHKACGDAWLTQGANKCPVCRAEAVHSSADSGAVEA